MIILVADTSVLIDLERGNLLQVTLAGTDAFATPDLLYNRELADNMGPELVRLGMQVLELTGPELIQVQGLRAGKPGLSIADCAAYVGALRPDHLLLAGDGLLRKHATASKIPCHGVLWLMDRLLLHGTTTAAMLHHGLTAIANHRNCRLPPEEIRTRLAAWAPRIADPI